MTTKLQQFIREHATITIACEPEHMHPKDAFDDERDVAAVLEKIKDTEWAWCCVCVTVTFEGMSECEYLGACSYDSEVDFVNSSGYYEDMLHTCFATLESRVKKLHETVQALIEPMWPL